jgi:hypothetical protein
MSEERKKSGAWPWIVALLIVLPVLYVLSFGPACWLASKSGEAYSDIRPSRGLFIYWPLGWCAETWGWENTAGRTVKWYAKAFLPHAGSVGLPLRSDGTSWMPIVRNGL